jgi:hypothetical protein
MMAFPDAAPNLDLPDLISRGVVELAFVPLHPGGHGLSQGPHLPKNFLVRILDVDISLPEIEPRHVPVFTVAGVRGPNGKTFSIRSEDTPFDFSLGAVRELVGNEVA